MSEIHLICSNCLKIYSVNQPIWRCTCGGLLDLQMEPEFPIDKIQKRPPTMWRYIEALPITSPENIISFSEGFTPLISLEFEGKMVAIKQDHLFPTGSYKDRGASMLISKASEIGVTHVVEDSSGNAGCAIAAYCAKASIHCDIYVPESTSSGKLTQIAQYGARLHQIPGSREDTANAVLDAAKSFYYASHSWNPFFFQGTKTFAFEIWEQSGFKSPEAIVLPAGNGTLVLGTWIGFNDLKNSGCISSLPKIFAVQAENCAPLFWANQKNLTHPVQLTSTPTLAEGIAIAEPVRGKQIIEAINLSKGAFLTVSENEIIQALISMHQKGFYIEPTSAATIAAIPKLVTSHQEINAWVSVFTGHGLKSTEKIMAIREHLAQ